MRLGGGRSEHARRVVALAVLGLLLVAGGAVLGSYVAAQLLGGFQLDWYAHPPERDLAGGALAAWAARVAGAAGLLGAALALGATHALARRLPPAPRVAHAWPASLHALVAAVVLPATLALCAWCVLLMVETWRPRAVWPAAAMAFAGAAAAGLAFVGASTWTWRALREGAIAPAGVGRSLLGELMVRSAARPRPVLALVALLSIVAANGAGLLTTDVDVVDVLPRGDPNSESAHNLTDRFKSTFTLQVTLHVRVDPARHAADDARHPYRPLEPQPGNITDEVYVRAMDELVAFVKAYVPEGGDHAPFRSSVGLPSFYRLINWTAAGGRDAPDESYALPSAATPMDAGRFALVHEGVWSQIPEAASALLSPDFEQAALLFLVPPDERMTSREIGEAALAARDAYVAWAANDTDAYKIFTGANAPLFTVDLPLANAHQSEMTEKDFRFLLPLVGAFIAVCLWFQFRDVRALVIAFTSLAVSVLLTFGVMGYLGLPLNTVNLTVVPLIMGVGIDYGIHVLNEHQHGRARGLTSAEAFRSAGRGTALSLFIATVTSVVGVAAMIVSPSLLVAQLGFLCCVALASTLLLTLTFVPAASALLDPGARHEYRPSRLMRATARAAGRYRYVALAFVGLLCVAAYASSAAITREPFGDPPRNWPEEDPLRVEHEAAGKGFYASPEPDAKANVLVFEGDVFHPDSLRYMDAIEASLKEQPRVMDHTLRTVPFILRTYLTVRDGLPGAGQYLLLNEAVARGAPQQLDPYPTTREEMVALAAEAAQTPLREFADLFYVWPDDGIAVMTFTARAATFEEAVEVWDQVWAAVAEAEGARPEGLKVAFVGNTATNYLFVEKQVPWIHKMAPLAAGAVVGLVLLLTRDLKAAFVVGVHNVVTGVLWLGLLPHLDVGLSITLTLPLLFIFAMGSDYGLHLALACRERDAAEVFATTGKAIVFSAITTGGAFALFAQTSNLAVQRAMVATAAAIVVIFVVTAVVVPAFYPPKRPMSRTLRPTGAAQPAAEASAPARLRP